MEINNEKKIWHCWFCERITSESRGLNIKKRHPDKRFCNECFKIVENLTSVDMEKAKKVKFENEPRPYRGSTNSFECGWCKGEILATEQRFQKCQNSSIYVCSKCNDRLIKDKVYYEMLMDRVKEELDILSYRTGNKIPQNKLTQIYSSINRQYRMTNFTYGGMFYTLEYCKNQLGYKMFNEHIITTIINNYDRARAYTIEVQKKRKANKDYKIVGEVTKVKLRTDRKFKYKKKYTMEDLLNE